MPVIKVSKFRDISSMERFLQGAIYAGQDPLPGYQNVVGKTLIFGLPLIQTVTLAKAAYSPTDLTFKDLKTQIEAALGGAVVVSILDQQLSIMETVPALGTQLTGGTALSLLGFDSAGALGPVYNYADGSAAVVIPHYVHSYYADGHHVLITRE
jgi:hypothetical protein